MSLWFPGSSLKGKLALERAWRCSNEEKETVYMTKIEEGAPLLRRVGWNLRGVS
ncbi:unnamed protein product [Tetraodon nigroviridis]|uniref:(spotted green pufferfish) hypothetical protein n=1 Tax=Tetraodon nigroviridis TaxID=99883 RepID=Q4SB90_TETNG|nr:unnamed protein product [Tetraodon nigroviridis]